MKNPLDSIQGTIVAGFVITVALWLIVETMV